LDSDGNIYVGEQGVSQRISVFDRYGDYLRQWGNPGSDSSQFSEISSMSFDSNEVLYVLEAGNNRIQTFDRFGNYLLTVGQEGSAGGEFQNPNGFIIGSQQEIYVADTGNNRVEKFISCAPAPTPTPLPTVVASAYDLRLDTASGQAYGDRAGNFWLPDTAYVTGGFGYSQGGQAVTAAATVSGTQDQSLYQTYRTGSALAYRFDNLPAGNYQVFLKFADFASSASGTNVFDVVSQGATVLHGVDVFAAMGHAAALDLNFTVAVADSAPLTVQLNPTAGQAILSAIEVRGLQAGIPANLFLVQPGGGALLP
jgi:hypothetical protein